MNSKKIQKFLDSVLKGIKFDFVFSAESTCQRAFAYVDLTTSVIHLNKERFHKFSEVWQKALLLHEVGHILNGSTDHNCQDEYLAQMTAIEIAKKNKWRKIKNELIIDIVSWAIKYKYSSKGISRRYVVASRRYIENNLLDEVCGKKKK